jgi:GrpB-like predicted nucleotidyltransferase (UPF0157 family)
LAATCPLGLENDQVRLVLHDNEWPAFFQNEASYLHRILNEELIAIEHIGSTAIPGLEAKPIIDVMIGVRDAASRARVAARLSSLDYIDKGERGIPGRTFLTKGDPVTHHLHLVLYNEGFWVDHLLFRDYLRNKPGIAQDYSEIKKKLAIAYPENRELYTLGKSDFIVRVVEQALAEFTSN